MKFLIVAESNGQHGEFEIELNRESLITLGRQIAGDAADLTKGAIAILVTEDAVRFRSLSCSEIDVTQKIAIGMWRGKGQ
jgi:hypothetical protein